MADIAHSYSPRIQFQGFHARHQRWSLIVAHRRAGKTVAVVNDLVVRALRTKKPNAFYAYIGPYFGQAKQTAWGYIKNALKPMIDNKTVKVSESESSVLLPNGAKIRVFGVDNGEALRGLYFDGVVCDEFGDWDGRTYTEVIRPALADRQGWAVFIGTPRGKNKFYELYQSAKDDPSRWYYAEVKASISGILPQAELDDLRIELDEDEFEQEMECNWTATIRGSYYGKHIADLERRGQLVLVGPNDLQFYDPSEPVSCAHDPGRDDAWAIWFWQVIGGRVRFIDYFEESGYDADEIVSVMEMKPYTYDTWWVPHDALHKTAQSKKSILDTFREANAPARKVPNPDTGNGVIHGINAVRRTLRTYPLEFDAVRCQHGVEALKNYSRKWNTDTKVFREQPSHDQWSHGADSFRYACLAINQEAIQASIDRAATKASKKTLSDASGSLNTSNSMAQGMTLRDAWAERDRLMASQNTHGRARI